MTKPSTTSTIAEDDVFSEITSIQPAADRFRFAALLLTGSLSAARKKSLLRQEKAAVARYGPASAEATSVRRRLQVEEQFTIAIQAEGQRTAVEPVQRNPRALILRGRVVNARRLGLSGLTVSAINSQGKPAASAVSSDTGYFEFQVPVRESDATETVSFLVSDRTRNIVYRGCECFEVKAGAVVTRELVIGLVEPKPQPTPPPEVDPKQVTVPDVQGLPQRTAELRLNALCLKPSVVTKETSPANAGRVVDQDPDPGAAVPLASTVTLTVGRAPATIEVPDLIGLSANEAAAKLKDSGLQRGSIAFEPAEGDKVEKVLRQAPEAGAQVDPGSSVDLVVGQESERVVVPNVRDRSLKVARGTLAKAQLSVGRVEPPQAPEEGVVVEQNPVADTQATIGSAVHLKVRVADAPPLTITVPNVVDRPLAEAERILKGARLTRGSVNPPDAGPRSLVIRQQPRADSSAKEGSGVDLEVNPETGGGSRPIPRKKTASKKRTTKKSSKASKSSARGSSKGDSSK